MTLVELITRYAEVTDWFIPQNICYLVYGKTNARLENYIDTILFFTLCRRKKKPFICLSRRKRGTSAHSVYAKPGSRPRGKGQEQQYKHDWMARNIAAKMLHETKHKYLDSFAMEKRGEKGEDFKMLFDYCGKTLISYWEMDRDTEASGIPRRRIKDNYLDRGEYLVVWIAADRYDEPDREPKRLKVLFDISRELAYRGKRKFYGRFLGACYTSFLDKCELRSCKDA